MIHGVQSQERKSTKSAGALDFRASVHYTKSMRIEGVQLCLAHETYSTVEDDCLENVGPHEYAYGTIEYDEGGEEE